MTDVISADRVHTCANTNAVQRRVRVSSQDASRVYVTRARQAPGDGRSDGDFCASGDRGGTNVRRPHNLRRRPLFVCHACLRLDVPHQSSYPTLLGIISLLCLFSSTIMLEVKILLPIILWTLVSDAWTLPTQAPLEIPSENRDIYSSESPYRSRSRVGRLTVVCVFPWVQNLVENSKDAFSTLRISIQTPTTASARQERRRVIEASPKRARPPLVTTDSLTGKCSPGWLVPVETSPHPLQRL